MNIVAVSAWFIVEVCTGMGTAGIRGFPAGMGLSVAGIPREWIWQLRDSHGDGFFFGGDPAGMIDKFGCKKNCGVDQYLDTPD